MMGKAWSWRRCVGWLVASAALTSSASALAAKLTIDGSNVGQQFEVRINAEDFSVGQTAGFLGHLVWECVFDLTSNPGLRLGSDKNGTLTISPRTSVKCKKEKNKDKDKDKPKDSDQDVLEFLVTDFTEGDSLLLATFDVHSPEQEGKVEVQVLVGQLCDQSGSCIEIPPQAPLSVLRAPTQVPEPRSFELAMLGMSLLAGTAALRRRTRVTLR